MIEDDASYFQRRAEQELEQAQRATKPEVVAVHCALANHYLARVADSTIDPGCSRPALHFDDAATGSGSAVEASASPRFITRMKFAR